MKKYTGSCLIGVVGPEMMPTNAMISIMNINRQPGDSMPKFIMATKGYVARQQHIDYWIDETEHEFCLLLDHDMIFQSDTLERLRAHELPFVSGYYLRRRFAPVAPVWFKPFSGEWPFEPWDTEPERGKLHEIGASGWGCILIHRDVVMSTREVLKGEPEVIEDDMDVWPYEIAAVLRGDEQIRPLRIIKDVVGSDIRYPFYARAAGWTLYGDADVRPAHILDYPLSPDDFDGRSPEQIAWFSEKTTAAVARRRERVQAARVALNGH